MTNKNLNLYNVIFYRKGKNHFFLYNNTEYEVNKISMNKLKQSLKLPFIVKFYALSKAQIQRTIRDLIDEGTDFKIYKVNKEDNKVLEYAASFFENKKTIDVYKVPNLNTLYGRSNDINPYMLTTLNNKKVLIEVTKDHVKKNEGEYYFLASELTEEERTSFDNFHKKIECDYIYELSEYFKEGNQKVKKR